MVKKTTTGKVISQVQGFKIRMKQNYTGKEKNKRVSGQDIRICKGKKLVESGFSSKKAAIERAKELV